MRVDNITEEIEIPEGVQVAVDKGIATVKGPLGEVSKRLDHPRMDIKVEGNKIILSSDKPSRRDKTMIYTYRAHFRNLVKGVVEKFKYQLKICSTHFPMNVTVNNKELTIKNFYGEKFPRVLEIKGDVDVKVNGDFIDIESIDREVAGRVSAQIEQMTRITNKDLRIFQDGIYIVNKAGKELK